ncbi:MAG: insulinase family protein [Candidatus Calescibacterium sp.]|nr:insulinase family protein [Candidatus Calescibacterium sp.]MDW8133298.1 insulinase family protein [Candidatus Calescibacterium sp.]
MVKLKPVFIFLIFIFFIFTSYTHCFELNDVYIERYYVGESKVFVIENSCLTLPSVGFVINKGAKDESPQYYGITHLWEHLFFRNKIDNKSIKELLIGTQYNATTYNDYIAFYAVGEYERILNTFLFSINNPNFDNEDLEIEKRVVITELAMKSLSMPNIFKVYTNPTGGTIRTVSNISYDVMVNFTKNIKQDDISFFIIDKNRNLDFRIFSKFYGESPQKRDSFIISLKPLTDNEIYQNYIKFISHTYSINFDISVNDDGIWLYIVSQSFIDEDLFLGDVVSYYIKYKINNDIRFKEVLYNRFSINNLEAFIYPQKYEYGLVIIAQASKKIDYHQAYDLEKFIISEIGKISYDEFYKIYYKMYLDLLTDFSDSWRFSQLISFFVYYDKWNLLNYYIKGVL